MDYLLTSYQPDFAVLRGRELVGVVLRDKVLEALRTLPVNATVDRLMLRDVPRFPADMPLPTVTEQMREAQSRVAAVYHDSHFAGLLARTTSRSDTWSSRSFSGTAGPVWAVFRPPVLGVILAE